jgi:hypothetical protein
MKKLKTIIPFVLGIALMLTAFNGCKQGAKKEGQEEAKKEETQKKGEMLNQLTQQEKEEGWKLLFNGENFEGWRAYNSESFPEDQWTIENNAMKCLGSGQGEAAGAAGDIIYDQKFKDFRLKFEWKISEGGNSGVFYLAKETPDEPIWKSAPEFQILDNANHPDAQLGKNGNRKAASLYDLIPADPQNTKPYGEWNEAEIMVYQGTVVHRQNGEDVVEYHLGTDDWKEMINNSKFSEFEEFGKYRNGYIGLQDHGNDVWYRNVKIKEL